MHSILKYCAALAIATCGIAAAPVIAAGPDQAFTTRCSMCHQGKGVGLPGQFPRLAGRAGAIAQTSGGRRYLALVVLNGLSGPISVDGKPMSSYMPAMGMVKDQEIADILNYLVTLAPAPKKKVAPYNAAEIAGIRAGGKMTAAQVAAERAKLVASNAIPVN